MDLHPEFTPEDEDLMRALGLALCQQGVPALGQE